MTVAIHFLEKVIFKQFIHAGGYYGNSPYMENGLRNPSGAYVKTSKFALTRFCTSSSAVFVSFFLRERVQVNILAFLQSLEAGTYMLHLEIFFMIIRSFDVIEGYSHPIRLI